MLMAQAQSREMSAIQAPPGSPLHFCIIREREGEEGDSTNVRRVLPTNFTDDLEMESQLIKRLDDVPCCLRLINVMK